MGRAAGSGKWREIRPQVTVGGLAGATLASGARVIVETLMDS